LAGCASGEDVPPQYGLYALEDGEMQRLDGNRAWEERTWEVRSAFSPEVAFFVFDPALQANAAPLEETVQLWRVASLRNELMAGGWQRPASGGKWVAPEGLPEYSVPLDFAPVAERSDAVKAKPRGDLAPGLYSLQLRAGEVRKNARVGVEWNEIDQQAYARRNCVDLMLTGEAGQPRRYQSCAG